MSLQVTIFLLLFGGLQGLLFSLFLLRKRLYNGAYVFLLLYFGVMILQITFKVMSKVWLLMNWLVFYNFSHFLPLLYGPLVYLFVKHLLHKKEFTPAGLLHFLPAAVALPAIFFATTDVQPNRLGTFFFNPGYRLIILSVSVAVYHVWAFLAWKRYSRHIGECCSDVTVLQMNWVKQFIFLSAFVCAVVVTALYLLYINAPNGQEYRFGFLVLTVFIYWCSYSALTKPAVFSIVQMTATVQAQASHVLPALKVYKAPVKYANSTLSGSQAHAIIEKLEKLMAEQKLYLQPSLTIDKLSEALEQSRHHLSQVLNHNLQLSYYDYINGLRIEESKRLLQSPAYEQHTIASIAYDAGFNSLSTFNEVFKKYMGTTPSDYRKSLLNNIHKQRI